MIEATNQTFDVPDTGIAVVDFWAPWCQPCKKVTPILEEMEKRYPQVTWFKVNAEENHLLALSYGVQSLPSVLVFQDGELMDGWMGLSAPTWLVRWLNEFNYPGMPDSSPSSRA